MGKKDRRQPPKNKSNGEKPAASTQPVWLQALQPVLLFLGTLLAAYFAYLGIIRPEQMRLSATQTAEARLTQIALLTTLTPTETLLPPTLTSTVIPTSTSTPTPTCLSYQRDTDSDTLTNLIMAEAEAVNTKNIGIIRDIFDPNAIIKDEDETPQIFRDPIARYTELFNTDFMGAQHFDILPAGPGITQTDAWFTSGSKGKYKNNGAWSSYSNPSTVSLPSARYGSDHWTFQKNSADCWVIIRFEFNAGHVQFPP